MSYGIRIVNKKNNNSVFINCKQPQVGGTICVDSERIAAEFTVTYNYSGFLYEAMGENGIRSLYGIPLNAVLTKLDQAINFIITKYYPECKWLDFKDHKEVDHEDYWKDCAAHVVKQLNYMRDIVLQCMELNDYTDYILKGD